MKRSWSIGPMGGGGGGGMMKTVHRAVRATSGGRGSSSDHFTINPNSSNHSPTYKPSSSSDNNNMNSGTLSLSSNHHRYSSSSVNNQFDDFVFCTVPSVDEVHDAISSLQQVLNPQTDSHDSEWDFDWIEPSTSMLTAHRGSESVYEAFRLLQTEPSVKKMVISLSSDKAVWEAIMNNEVVRELRDSVYEAKINSGEEGESTDDPTPVPDVLKWIFNNTKAKMMEIVKKAAELVNRLFWSSINEKGEEEGATTGPIEMKLRSSFFLSVMVILIVVVTRSCKL